MCDKEEAPRKGLYEANQTAQPRESHMVYELKQKREYHLQQLAAIQKAIEAINQVSALY